MEVIDAIHRRRAVRRFLPKTVSKADIRTILEAANWAPSAMNRQQWEFLIVSGKKIGEMGESFGRIIEAYTRNWDASRMKGSPFTRGEFVRFAATYGGAPVVIVVLTDTAETKDLQRANLESASAALQNLLLAATALGLGTCWMTGPLQDENALRRILVIPENKELVAVTPLGYPAAIPEAPPRLDPSMEQKVRWVE
jgi:nitroreductase